MRSLLYMEKEIPLPCFPSADITWQITLIIGCNLAGGFRMLPGFIALNFEILSTCLKVYNSIKIAV